MFTTYHVHISNIHGLFQHHYRFDPSTRAIHLLVSFIVRGKLSGPYDLRIFSRRYPRYPFRLRKPSRHSPLGLSEIFISRRTRFARFYDGFYIQVESSKFLVGSCTSFATPTVFRVFSEVSETALT